MKKFLIIKTGSTIPSLLARGEDFEHWFIAGSNATHAQFQVCHLHLGEALPVIDQVQGIFITGSAAYITDEAAWNFTGATYLRAAREAAVPILGVCYGHQMLAWAFGGEVGFHPAGREIGTVEITCTNAANQDRLFNTLPACFKAQVSHQQSVLRLPPDATLLAANAFDPHHAFRLDESIWGVQFHPEFNMDISRAYIEARADAITREGLQVASLLAQLSESQAAATLLANFTQYCVRRSPASL